ncbi:CAP domain-containing protein [Metabacillus iocasae]|uniref:YkwD family protein n=1 Tax=Priestia iocasae TaxID=2291674 RepID=A0ABS2R002_9BACI|nr:CAP domain-containing protein [Metabacillus iocasae]MBM7704311.1 putative YkwD family protein [Metabacillus iocasae]
MNKKIRVAAIAGAVSVGLLTAGQASAATPNCNVPKNITVKDAQAAQNINVDELMKKFNIQVQTQAPQKAQAAAPAPAPEKQAEAQPQEQAQAPQQAEAQPAQESEKTEQKAEAGDVSEYEQQVVQLVNQEREKQGLKPLQLDKELSDVAREKSKDMKEKGYFDHNSPTYGSPFDMMKQFGIEYTAAGENIAKGQKTPEEVMDGWMNSDGHRKNIMNPNFTHIGVGYVDGEMPHWTQMFITK